MFLGSFSTKIVVFLLNLLKIRFSVGFIGVWSTHFENTRVQEGSPVLIFSHPKGLLRVTQYSVLGKKCQNTLIARVLKKSL